MPKPTKINKKKRENIIKKYRKKLDDPDIDEEIKQGVIKVSSFESELDLFETQIADLRSKQRIATEVAQDEIDKIQEEIRLVEGGIFVKEDEVITRHYYLKDQGTVIV